MRRVTINLPDDLDAKLRHEGEGRRSTITDVIREAVEAHAGGVARRRLIAAKAARSGSHDGAPSRDDHPAGGPPIALIVDAGPLYALCR
ncbi:MAG TPA: ribbon-helix-helix domain-containing protein [Thermoanaerobaculia bacterium]|nr:ribbon-helix-helix domain-containing protein [Thermoanaerobaculia bacterium]